MALTPRLMPDVHQTLDGMAEHDLGEGIIELILRSNPHHLPRERLLHYCPEYYEPRCPQLAHLQTQTQSSDIKAHRAAPMNLTLIPRAYMRCQTRTATTTLSSGKPWRYWHSGRSRVSIYVFIALCASFYFVLIIRAYHSEEEMLCRRFPMRRYPSELLAQVFLWYILDLYRFDTGLALHRGLLTIRHVCRTWRAAALEHPILSSFIPITHPSLVQDLFATSESLPLHVCEELGPSVSISVSMELRRLILRHIERVQSAQLAVTNELVDPQRSPDNVRSGESPLHSLLLCYILPPHGWTPAPFLPNVNFPELVDLSCYFGPLSCFSKQMKAPSLRRLDVQNPHTSPTTTHSNGDILSILRGLPLLEELLLRNVGFDSTLLADGAPAAALQPTVNLPCLRLLTIYDRSLEPVLSFVHQISYPATTSVLLRFSSGYDGWFSEEENPLWAILPAVLYREAVLDTSSTAHRARSASVVADQASFFSFSTWPEHRPPADLRAHSHQFTRTPGTRHIIFDGGGLTPQAASSLVRHMPLAEVESLLISEPYVNVSFATRRAPAQTTSRIPTNILGALPALTELVLEYESFDRAHAADPADPAAAPNEPVDIAGLFPGVKTVHIRELHHALPSCEHAKDHSRVRYLGEAFVARAAEAFGVPHARHGDNALAPGLQISRARIPYTEPPSYMQRQRRVARHALGGAAGPGDGDAGNRVLRNQQELVGHEVGGPPGLEGMPSSSFLAQKDAFSNALRASRGRTH